MKTNILIHSFFILFITLFFTACSSQRQPVINDLTTYPQNASYYTQFVPKDIQQEDITSRFNRLYFAPWHMTQHKATLEEVTWGNSYQEKTVYGENHIQLTNEWFKKHIDNSNFKNYNTLLQKAITIKNSNLRVFPTIHKMFYNPKKVGEGYPFDYNQNSGIKINSPLLISHLSKDKAWAFVSSSFASGWISIHDIATVDTKLMQTFENGNYSIAIRDNFPIYKNAHFIEYIKLGTLFPLNEQGQAFIVQKHGQEGILSPLSINDYFVQKQPLPFNKSNVTTVINELIKEPYGWGELLTNRDCSALTRDVLAPFGFYLDRNSRAQTFNGNTVKIGHLSAEEKKELIKQQAIPFVTLLYMKGHIMLYLGEYQGELLAFHNIWGIKTKTSAGEEGRVIIGKAVITSLEVGKELQGFNTNSSLLNRLSAITILTQKPAND